MSYHNKYACLFNKKLDYQHNLICYVDNSEARQKQTNKAFTNK
jgi:hypothetical protein